MRPHENIVVERGAAPLPDEGPVEIVERKGKGHPDSIADAVMDAVSVRLSGEYLRRFGAVLHHNCDKGLLVAGRAETAFGGGRVLDPMRLIFGDRATFDVGRESVDVAALAVGAAKDWIRANLRFVDPDEHVHYQVELRPGSEALVDLFRRGEAVLPANDTSAAVGFAPLTDTERLVLETERFLNGPSFKDAFPETGEDVKVMGYRRGGEVELTVAMPLVDRVVASEADYFRRKSAITDALREFVEETKGGLRAVRLELNACDAPGRGTAGVYLSVLGTSADHADSGAVGRGNRVNGLISLQRPRGAEAAAGKNPVSHVGKIYNVLAQRVATDIHEHVPGVRGVTLWLASRIGRPIDEPALASAAVTMEEGASFEAVEETVRERISSALVRLPAFCLELARGEHPVC